MRDLSSRGGSCLWVVVVALVDDAADRKGVLVLAVADVRW